MAGLRRRHPSWFTGWDLIAEFQLHMNAPQECLRLVRVLSGPGPGWARLCRRLAVQASCGARRRSGTLVFS